MLRSFPSPFVLFASPDLFSLLSLSLSLSLFIYFFSFLAAGLFLLFFHFFYFSLFCTASYDQMSSAS
uniref:Uncharacterized protein n=1 Tax=Arundo donax TaxID=35708 RepID=A0A0A9G5N3_ARUDO